MRVADSMLDLIGGTPMVRIRKMAPAGAQVYAKLEKFNPGGSVKDRIACEMLSCAERSGILRKGMTIVEPSSGNTGIGIALVAAVKGYRLIIVMPEDMSMERRKILQAYGAEIVLTPAGENMDGAIRKATQLSRKPNHFMPNQFSNQCNVLAHYRETACEIIQQAPDLTTFVAGMGTGGTLMGAARRLKQHNPEIQIVGVSPPKHEKIQGLKNMETSQVPRIFDESRLDKKVYVSNKDAVKTARRLAREEGIFAGISSGAAMHAALSLAKPGTKTVVLLPDGGERYLSTNLVP